MIDIRGLRQRLKMTQPQFAKAVGSTERSVRRWEQDHMLPRHRQLEKMAELERQLDSPRTARPLGLAPSSL